MTRVNPMQSDSFVATSILQGCTTENMNHTSQQLYELGANSTALKSLILHNFFLVFTKKVQYQYMTEKTNLITETETPDEC